MYKVNPIDQRHLNRNEMELGNQWRVFMNKVIGKGFFGKVFEGEQKDTRRKIAIKEIDFLGI